jgi:16S rRNA (cytosine1402-N4)-methyltransferase
VLDCTLGYGGHSIEIIKKILPAGGKLFALDQDIIEIDRTERRLRDYLNQHISEPTRLQIAQNSIHFIHGNFRELKSISNKYNLIGKVDCIIIDLGFSSMQIDDPNRGFTYKYNGPLDMRMNINSTLTAQILLETIEEDDLINILQENSDEIYASAISKSIKNIPLPQSTIDLAERVRNVYNNINIPSNKDIEKKKFIDSAIARTMQAIRIAVNDEFGALDELLTSLPDILSPNGKVVILTFHSGEDRRVKKSFKSGFSNNVYSSWSRDVIRASYDEQRNNPRSKCAKLRWAIRSTSPLSTIL